MIKAEKVIVTMFVNDSLKKTTVASIITQPYYKFKDYDLSYLKY